MHLKKQKKNKLMGVKIAGIEIHSTCTDKIKNVSTEENTWDYYNSKEESKWARYISEWLLLQETHYHNYIGQTLLPRNVASVKPSCHGGMNFLTVARIMVYGCSPKVALDIILKIYQVISPNRSKVFFSRRVSKWILQKLLNFVKI